MTASDAGLIAAAGIRRVVAPTDLETDACVVSAEEFGIEMVKLRDAPPRKVWRDGLAEKHRDNDAILAARLMRKKLKKDKTFGKKVKATPSPPKPKYPPGDFSPGARVTTPPRAGAPLAATPVRPRAPD